MHRHRKVYRLKKISTMIKSEEILRVVSAAIEALPYNRRPSSLYEPIRYVLSMGGKRIRPVLMLLTYNLYRDDIATILPQACALETYHNYTLLHDDLMDNAALRRGHATVHTRWNDNTAILSGDTMLVLAYRQMAQCDNNSLAAVMQLFTETAIEIGEGQQYDMDFEQRDDVSEDEYIEMIRLKTGVLLACATKMGAMLAGAPDDEADRLYRFGEALGLAFQLQDDYLDVYGDTKVLGKAIGGDIVSNKKTYMLINAMRLADAAQRAEIDRWLAAKPCDAAAKIAAITRIYNAIGIDRLAITTIDNYFRQSLSHLEEVQLPAENKQELRRYVADMMRREY